MYCSPLELSSKIAYNTPVFVIEMNNFTNKIEGIGLIKNKPEMSCAILRRSRTKKEKTNRLTTKQTNVDKPDIVKTRGKILSN
jgi:hypothetical protein